MYKEAYRLQCDRCNYIEIIDKTVHKPAKLDISSNGWRVVVDNKLLCPECLFTFDALKETARDIFEDFWNFVIVD